MSARKTVAARVGVGLTPRIMVDAKGVFGPGKADLLERIEAAGSISAAARDLDMSYSRAWTLVDEMNHAFKTPLVEAATGGKRGGGAQVTPEGRTALALFRRMQKKLNGEAETFAGAFSALLK